MKFGSVCSGIEAASVAWHPLGWTAAWLAEIEPFPSAVLKHHYPDVPNLGDMTKLPERIRSGEIEAPDIFCGGTPCQAFSVAGLRKSLDDARGNLSLTFCEIANEIDSVRSVRGEHPAIVFWENVPGVLNTKDNAFGCFLAGLAGEDDPLVPAGDKWTNAGCVFGPKRTVAWRVLDAQYFGVAQRRRRVFVVASARTGFDPAAVLFEFEGVRRDIAPSRQAGEGSTHPTSPCLTSSGRGVERTGDTSGQDPVVAVITMAHGQGGAEIGFDRAPTLTCNHEAPISAYATCITGDITHTLKAEGFDASEDGTGRGTPMVPVAFVQNSRDEVRLMGGDGGIVGALAAETGAKQQCYIAVPCVAFPANLSGTQCASAVDVSQALGALNPTAIAFNPNQEGMSLSNSVTTPIGASTGGGNQGCVAVAVALRGREGGATAELGDEVQNCLRASGGGGDKAHVLAPVVGWDNDLNASQEQMGTLLKGGDGGRHEGVMLPSMQVRRLTPVECERLQGFPDGYTHIPWRKKPADVCPDGPRYKALGNSWAVPNVAWIGRRIAAALAETDAKAVSMPT